MNRRGLITGALALAAAPAFAEEAAFDPQTPRTIARELAAKDYKAPDTKLPNGLDQLSMDTYRAIRFDAGQALWHGQGLPFEVQFFPRGAIYAQRVDIFEVSDGKAVPLAYGPGQFSAEAKLPPDLGFAGFRVHGAGGTDEVVTFLGASYFRAVARGQRPGVSARALAIKTGDATGEEFPSFRAFWIERPERDASGLVIHAVVDSPSAAGALRFSIRPGDVTIMDVELTLFPRVDIDQPGIAGMSSMYLFGPLDRGGFDDLRAAVHDSDGLMIRTGRNEALWRPVSNPRTLQLSAFVDTSPRGFGLMQRARAFPAYEDLNAQFERRPSLWIEPVGDWGEGAVQLVEIPSKAEIHDNLIAFWRPKGKLGVGEHGFTYRMHWGAAAPGVAGLGQVVGTRGGASAPGTRLYAVDFAGGRLGELTEAPRPAISAEKGRVDGVSVQRLPDDGWRLRFTLVTEDARSSELRATLMVGDAPVTETWLFRWTA